MTSKSGNSEPATFKSLLRSKHASSSNPDHLLLELSHQLLGEGKGVRFKAPGRSMHPTIRENETITVEPIAPSAIEVGDIILYRLDDGVIAHRIKGIEGAEGNGTRFILRGDASANSDAPVNTDQILGKVISVERGGRSIDPYSTRTKIFCTSYILASRFKQWLIRAVRFNQ